MHIGLVSPAWPLGWKPNGIVPYVHYLRKGLVQDGHEVSVFSRDVGDAVVDRDVHRLRNTGRFERVWRRLSGRPGSVFDAWSVVAEAINAVHRKHPLDVVEMEETFGLAGPVARSIDAPLVVKLHGPAFLNPIEGKELTDFERMRIEAEGSALRASPALTAPSNWTLQQTLARYALRPTIAEAVGNPIEAETAVPLWTAQACDRRRVVFVGRFDKVKGGDLAIDAFQRLRRRHPEARLTFVGPDRGLLGHDGVRRSLADYVASLRDPETASRIEHVGHQDGPMIQALRSRAAVILVASRQESQGYTALEAMLQSCPLVCTNSSGLAELVEHRVTGLKARDDDAQDIADSLAELIESPDLSQSIGLAARDYVLDRHSPGRIAKLTVDVYRRAIAHRAHGR